MADKQQFNVGLDPDLIRSVKHLAVDVQLSLSDLVSAVLRTHLESGLPDMTEPSAADSGAATRTAAEPPSSPPASGLRLQPMVHVDDMRESVGFYEALGARVVLGSRDGDFAQLRLGASELSLLAHPPNPEQDEGTVELNFVTDEDLSVVESRLRQAGVQVVASAGDEAFGEQLQVRTPDGLLVKINRMDPELYT